MVRALELFRRLSVDPAITALLRGRHHRPAAAAAAAASSSAESHAAAAGAGAGAPLTAGDVVNALSRVPHAPSDWTSNFVYALRYDLLLRLGKPLSALSQAERDFQQRSASTVAAALRKRKAAVFAYRLPPTALAEAFERLGVVVGLLLDSDVCGLYERVAKAKARIEKA